MITRQDIENKRDAIFEIVKRHGGLSVSMFGSVARGEANEHSDLDLVVKFEPGRSLMDHGMMIEDLQDFLGIKVDIISEAALRDRFRTHIAKELVRL